MVDKEAKVINEQAWLIGLFVLYRENESIVDKSKTSNELYAIFPKPGEVIRWRKLNKETNCLYSQNDFLCSW